MVSYFENENEEEYNTQPNIRGVQQCPICPRMTNQPLQRFRQRGQIEWVTGCTRCAHVNRIPDDGGRLKAQLLIGVLSQ